MYNKNYGSNGRRETWEVELTVADDELKAALTTGGPIGITARRYLIWFGSDNLKLSLVPMVRDTKRPLLLYTPL